MYGYTLVGRDGGEEYTSDAEFETYAEAHKAGELDLVNSNSGSLEVWHEV